MISSCGPLPCTDCGDGGPLVVVEVCVLAARACVRASNIVVVCVQQCCIILFMQFIAGATTLSPKETLTAPLQPWTGQVSGAAHRQSYAVQGGKSSGLVLRAC